MEHLSRQLDHLIESLPDEDRVREKLKGLVSVYPFNEYEYIISNLLAADILQLDDYIELRDDFISRNPYLYIFEISALRTFGESWAQEHLKGLVPNLEKPSKKTDSEYSGQYDLRLDNIRVG